MGIKLTEFYTNCPNCKRALLKNDPKAVHAEITVGNATGSYVFCNRSCMHEKMEKINPPVPDGQFEFDIELSVKEKILTSPETWVLIYNIVEPKFELIVK